jgi:hypothetical protein
MKPVAAPEDGRTPQNKTAVVVMTTAVRVFQN